MFYLIKVHVILLWSPNSLRNFLQNQYDIDHELWVSHPSGLYSINWCFIWKLAFKFWWKKPSSSLGKNRDVRLWCYFRDGLLNQISSDHWMQWKLVILITHEGEKIEYKGSNPQKSILIISAIQAFRMIIKSC